MRANKVLTSFLLCFYLVALGSFGIRLRWIFILMLGTVFFSFLLFRRRKIIQIDYFRKRWIIIVAVCFILMILPNARHDADIYNDMIYIFVCTFAAITCVTDKKEVGTLFKIIIRAGIIMAIYLVFTKILSGLYLNYIVPHLGSEVRERVRDGWRFGYGAAVGNSYTFADNVIMMGIALTVGDDIVRGGKSIKDKIFLIIMFAGILMEGRKGELASGLIAVLIIYFIHANHKAIMNPRKKVIWFVVATVSIVLIVSELGKRGYLIRFQQLFDRVLSSRAGEDVDYTSGRFDLWRYAFQLFLQNPLIGAGWGRFANYTTGVFQEVYNGQTIMDVHNVFLQLLCETGIIGTMAIVIPLLCIYKKTYQHTIINRMRGYLNKEESKISIFALTLFTYFIVLSFMDPVFTNNNFWCVFAVAIMFESSSTKIDCYLLE